MKSKSRGIVILYEDITDYWIELMKEAELTALGIHKIAIPGTRSVDTLLDELSALHGRELIYSIENAGITVEYELHVLEWLLPRNLFKVEPELFRMDSSGIRNNDFNLCPSNHNALEIIADHAYKLAKQLQQTSDNYYLWLDDAADSHCSCEACLSLNQSDQAVLTVNAILKGLRLYNPCAKISFLSYSGTLQIPVIKPADGVFLEFAPMNRDHTKPINASGNTSGRIYTNLLPQLLEIFKPEETHILEYWLDNALYSGYRMPPVKVPFLSDVTEADVRYYSNMGIQNIKSFGSYIGGEYFKMHGKPPVKEYGKILKKYIN
ncbi:MAG: DUF4838 domain-containing protein [Eubacteriales bacterium]